MLATNYSAYWNIAASIIYAEEMEITKKSLIQSVAAASVDDEKNTDTQEQDTFKQLSKSEVEKYKHTPSMHSIGGLIANGNNNEVDL
jgi:hypothetical protein